MGLMKSGKDQGKDQGLNQEASLLIELGNLLQKERSEEQQAKVRAVINDQGLANSEKLRRIQQLDAAESDTPENKVSSWQGPQKPAGEDSPSIQAKTEKQMERYQQQWKLLKKPLQRKGFFSYFFHEYRRIKDFGRRTRTLHATLLPPRLYLAGGLETAMAHTFQKTASQLEALLHPVEEMGWLVLSKEEYNRVALLLRLCREIGRIHLGDHLPSLLSLESLYLAVLQDRPLPTIRHSLKRLEVHRSTLVKDAGQVIGLAEQLLSPDALLPSFPHLIQAVNMVRYRRFVELDDLKREALEERIIPTAYFDAPPAVSRRIARFVQSTDHKLTVLHKHWTQIQRVKQFLPQDEESRLDLPFLAGYYEQTPAGESRGPSFSRDNKAVNVFFYRLITAVLSDYAELLNGQPVLRNQGKIPVFDRTCFEKTMAKLYQLKENFETLSATFPNFSRQRFFELQKKENRGAIAVEREAASEIREVCQTGKHLSVLLSHLLIHEKRKAGTSAEGRDAEDRGAEGRDAEGRDAEGRDAEGRDAEGAAPARPLAMISLKESSFVLPGAGSRIEEPRALRGKTVREALTVLTQIGYLLHAYFLADDFSSFQVKEEQISREITKRLNRIARVGQPEETKQAEDKVFPFRVDGWGTEDVLVKTERPG